MKSMILKISLMLRAFLYNAKNLEAITKFTNPIMLKRAEDSYSIPLAVLILLFNLSIAVSLIIKYRSTWFGTT